MLYRLLRPLLFRLNPEVAHDLAVRSMTVLSRLRPIAGAVHGLLARPGVAPVEAMGLRFPHPIGLAAGFDKNAAAPLAWWAVGFGFIELGTVTPRPKPGNPRPRMFRLPERSALINRMGFNNLGAEAVAARLEAMQRRGLRPPIPIGISIGKNQDTPLERAAEDYQSAAARLGPYADFLTVNVSSPNTPGLRDLQTASTLEALVKGVRSTLHADKPVLVKIAPELEGDALFSVLAASLAAGAAGFIATNTRSTAGMAGLETGGLSGRPLREISLQRVRDIVAHVGRDVTVIGCGGIDDADSARAHLDAGAKLVQLYTGLVYHGPFLAARIARGLNGRRALA